MCVETVTHVFSCLCNCFRLIFYFYIFLLLNEHGLVFSQAIKVLHIDSLSNSKSQGNLHFRPTNLASLNIDMNK